MTTFPEKGIDMPLLGEVLLARAPNRWVTALEITRQLCSGLAAVHEQELLHRDLKPANVMLDGRGKVR